MPVVKSAAGRAAAGASATCARSRKWRSPPAGTSSPCGGPAGSGRQRHHANQRAGCVERRGAGKARQRRRFEQPFAVRHGGSQARGRSRHGGGARLQLRIGHAHQRHIVSGGIRGRDRHRVKWAGAVETQQRQVRVRGLALRVAQSGDGDDQTSLGGLAVGDDAAGGVDHNAGRVFDAPLRLRSDQCSARKRRKRACYRGDKTRKRALRRHVVADGGATHLPALDRGAHGEFLDPALLPGNHEKIRPQHRALDAAGRILAVLIKHRRKRRAGRINAKGLDLQLAMRRGEAACVGALRGARHELRGHAEPHPRCRIVEQAPADGLASGAGRRGEFLLLLRVEHPGWLAAVAALKCLHGRNRARRHLAIGDTLIVPRPNQIGLKSNPLGERERGVELGRPRRRWRWRAGGRERRSRQRDDEGEGDAPGLAGPRAAHGPALRPRPATDPPGGRNCPGPDIG